MPFWRFQFFSAIGGLLWATLIGTAGYVLGSNLALVGIVIRDIGIGGLVVLVVIGLVVALARWRAVRQR
jgi:membrane protein DedA with SNARE-associated domain